MIEDQARQDIAFIRHAIEDGRGYANARSPDMVVWGVAVAVGYLGSYAFRRGWSPVEPGWLWIVCIALPWLYSLRRVAARLAGGAKVERRPMAAALRMLWFGCGVFLTSLGVLCAWSGDIRQGWFNAVVAGVLGLAFFVSARLSDLAWFTWVAIAWWLGEVTIFALRHDPAVAALSAALMLLLLAGPGLVLLTGRGTRQAT